MIVDSSALIAVITSEPGAELLIDALSSAPVCRVSAAIFVETSIVLEAQHGAEVVRQFDALLRQAEFIIEPITHQQAQIARQAFVDYGKGRHPAGLNFGDCFSYALAKDLGEPLLYKGEDFSKTDIQSASR